MKDLSLDEIKYIKNGWYSVDGRDVFLYDGEYGEGGECVKCLGDIWDIMDFLKTKL